MGRTSDVFHVFTIEGHKFSALMATDGPYISMTDPSGLTSGVSMGVSRVNYFPEDSSHLRFGARESGWWLAKYDNQPRINLNGLSESAREEVMRQFGILSVRAAIRQHPADAFRNSPAFQGLRDWVQRHPRIAKASLRSQTYIAWGSMVQDLMQPKESSRPGAKARPPGLWTVTITDVSGFPRVAIADTRDHAIAEFMQQAYRFAQTQPGEYYVVGEERKNRAVGLHLIRDLGVDEGARCVLSMSPGVAVVPDGSYKPEEWGKWNFVAISKHLDEAIQDYADPDSPAAKSLKKSVVARLLDCSMAERLLDDIQEPSGKLLVGKPSDLVWHYMGKARMSHLAILDTSTQPKPHREQKRSPVS